MQGFAIFLVLGLVLAGPALADRKLLQGPTIAPASGITSPSPPTPATPPTAPPPSPVGPQQCTCSPSVDTEGHIYCMITVKIPAGETTSTACQQPMGLLCTATQAFAGRFAPVAGPVFQCTSEALSTHKPHFFKVSAFQSL